MIRFLTLASSSAGNASLLSWDGRHLLIDAGISCLRIKRGLNALGLSVEDLSALLITHAHSVHIAGLATLVRRCPLPIYATAEAARQVAYRVAGAQPLLRPLPADGGAEVGGFFVTAFPTSHDSPGAAAFRIDCAGRSLGLLTDTGVVPQGAACLLGVDLLVLEANHDVDMLRAGPYPYPLKERVLGRRGHLSNAAAARFAREAALRGTSDILLAHLSQENNTPQAALETVSAALEAVDYAGRLSVAPRDTCSDIHLLEERPCSVLQSSALES